MDNRKKNTVFGIPYIVLELCNNMINSNTASLKDIVVKTERFTTKQLEQLLKVLDKDTIHELPSDEKWQLYNTLMNILRDCEGVFPEYYEELHDQITEICSLE
jgi:hypothetical protein